jgi:hypothetical protein
MSYVLIDIQKSKLDVGEKCFAKHGKTYNCLGFFTNSSKISCENCFLEAKITIGIIAS